MLEISYTMFISLSKENINAYRLMMKSRTYERDDLIKNGHPKIYSFKS